MALSDDVVFGQLDWIRSATQANAANPNKEQGSTRVEAHFPGRWCLVQKVHRVRMMAGRTVCSMFVSTVCCSPLLLSATFEGNGIRMSTMGVEGIWRVRSCHWGAFLMERKQTPRCTIGRTVSAQLWPVQQSRYRTPPSLFPSCCSNNNNNSSNDRGRIECRECKKECSNLCDCLNKIDEKAYPVPSSPSTRPTGANGRTDG